MTSDRRRLGDLGIFLKGRGITRAEVTRSGVGCLRYGEIYTSFGDYVHAARSFVDVETALTATPLEPGDIVFAGSGETKGEIGKNTAWIGEERAVAGGDTIILRAHGQDPVFLSTLLNSNQASRQKASRGQGDAVVHISATALAGIVVDLPPLSVQRAIRQVLVDADDLIASLERLVEKKQAIMRGVGQQLLTGKTRLPGFNQPWEEVTVAQLLEPRSETNQAGRELEVLSCSKHRGIVRSLDYFRSQVFSRDLTGYRLAYRGDIAYPANHVEEGSIGVQELVDVGLVSPIYVVMQPKPDVDSFFLFKMFKLDSFRQTFSSATNSSVNRRGSLRWPEFSRISAFVPAYAEQVAIAGVIRGGEDELECLNTRLVKARQIKRGMIQELLTGRTHLREGDSAA